MKLPPVVIRETWLERLAPVRCPGVPARVLGCERRDASRNGLARDAPATINEIIKGKRPINAEAAFTLGTSFSMDPQFWINLQSRYDLRRVEIEKSAEIRNRVQPLVNTVRQTLPESD